MKTTYLKNKLLDHLTGRATFNKPANTFVGLLTSDPTVAGLQTAEVYGGSYARHQAAWNAAANGNISTSNVTQFNNMPTSTIRYWAIFDAAAGGNMLEYFPFELPIETNTGLNLTFAAGNLMLREN